VQHTKGTGGVAAAHSVCTAAGVDTQRQNIQLSSLHPDSGRCKRDKIVKTGTHPMRRVIVLHSVRLGLFCEPDMPLAAGPAVECSTTASRTTATHSVWLTPWATQRMMTDGPGNNTQPKQQAGGQT
jgi:hypothetical protein